MKKFEVEISEIDWENEIEDDAIDDETWHKEHQLISDLISSRFNDNMQINIGEKILTPNIDYCFKVIDIVHDGNRVMYYLQIA